MATQILIRRGTAVQWTSANTLLSSGELGFETNTGKFKIGNGSKQWNLLEYAANTPTEIATIVTALTNYAEANARPNLITTATAPTSTSAAGTVGSIRFDSNYIYICVNTNTWKRAPLSAW